MFNPFVAPNPCHRRDPRLILFLIRHRLSGPRRGCSCSRCFYHPKRRVPAREVYRDRQRLAEAESRIRDLERALTSTTGWKPKRHA
jgi:hypothetical protein